MDLKELQKQFDKISKQVERETKSLPALALLMNTLLGLFKILFGLLNEQNKTICWLSWSWSEIIKADDLELDDLFNFRYLKV